MTSDPIQVSYTTLASLKRQLTDLSLALDNSVRPLREGASSVVEGAGEVGGALADGVAEFELSWGVALRVMAAGSALVGNNVGELELDLTAMDVHYSSDVRL